ncbi:hypothetical protein [Glycomyces sp. YM15]|uniref:hypothetical protein n=1 Tax=Glycomyces sp. YM15 TaxID=2800446 RepID=UPI001962B00B|nr:hypothetical protein [Glycomyces sp. YM15]
MPPRPAPPRRATDPVVATAGNATMLGIGYLLMRATRPASPSPRSSCSPCPGSASTLGGPPTTPRLPTTRVTAKRPPPRSTPWTRSTASPSALSVSDTSLTMASEYTDEQFRNMFADLMA